MSHSLLCETVTGATMAELVGARDAATPGDLVELRLDGVGNLEVAAALRGRQRPAIVTCRPVWEGGRFDGDEESRLRVLSQALDLGAEYVDVEWRAVRDDARRTVVSALMRQGGERVIVSSHDFDGMPEDLAARAQAMRSSGAGTMKIAATPARLTDTLLLRDVARGPGCAAVVIGMGDTGLSTRLLATRFGSRWTYGGNAVAPGQMPSARMIQQYRFKSIDESTSLYGVVGKDAVRAISPVLHNAAFAAAGLNAVCVPLQTTDFRDFLAFADALQFSGASLVTSFDRDAVAALTHCDDAARRAGTANVVRRTGSTWESGFVGISGSDGRKTRGDAPVDSITTEVAIAEQQFEWWTGHRPAAGVMQAAAELERRSLNDAHDSYADGATVSAVSARDRL